MPSLLNAEKALIFRITHRANIPWILANGLHCRSSNRLDPNFVSIGNASLINDRQHVAVPIQPRGTLSDYIPFYFTPHSVMLLNIKTGYRGVQQRRNDEIVILVSSLPKLTQDQIRFVFTDRHARLAAAEFFDDPTNLDKIDWKILQKRDFSRDDNDLGKMERYQAESLVHRHMPTSSLLGIACYNTQERDRVDTLVRGAGLGLRVIRQPAVVLLMISFTQGNLLEAKAEALVNTVNTVGVMGKGIALMFKEAFPENFRLYKDACRTKSVKIGHVFATKRRDFVSGPKWIINFPTKEHWRAPSRLEWIRDGLISLRHFVEDHSIRSIALPPLGSGNGGLDWQEVRPLIVKAFESLQDVTIIVYEPTRQYQNVSKREGVEKLTPARALLTELIRRYWILGIECTVLEVQKLAYFLERQIITRGLANPLNLEFHANRFGPFSTKLRHLLDLLDGSYLHCDKRLADAGPMDVIGYDEAKMEKVDLYVRTAATMYTEALDATSNLIEGFESPLGMELLATVDWLIHHDRVAPHREAIKDGLRNWTGGEGAGARKLKLFNDRMIDLALFRLDQTSTAAP